MFQGGGVSGGVVLQAATSYTVDSVSPARAHIGQAWMGCAWVARQNSTQPALSAGFRVLGLASR